MASVVFENASRIYPGTTKPAVDKLNLTVNDGEFLAVSYTHLTLPTIYSV